MSVVLVFWTTALQHDRGPLQIYLVNLSLCLVNRIPQVVQVTLSLHEFKYGARHY